MRDFEMLQKEKHEYIKTILRTYTTAEELSAKDFSQVSAWYAESSFSNGKKVARICVEGAKFGTKCLRFIFEDGTTRLVSRHIVVGKKSKK